MGAKIGAIILLFLALALVSAELPDPNALNSQLEQGSAFIESESSQADFIMAEWGRFLENTFIGKKIVSAGNFLSKQDAIFMTLLGLGFSWSLSFLFSFFIWLLLIVYAYSLFSVLQLSLPFQRYASLAKLGAFAAFFVLISTIRIPRYSAHLLTTLVEQIDGLWFRIIAIFVVFALFLFALFYVGFVNRWVRKVLYGKEIQRTKEKVTQQGKSLEILGKELAEEKSAGLSEKDRAAKHKLAEDELGGALTDES